MFSSLTSTSSSSSSVLASSTSTSVLLSHHPLDIRPLGDALYTGNTNIARYIGLGPYFSKLPDDLLIQLFSLYCTSNDYGKLNQCSKILYAFTSTDDQWRNFTLAEYGVHWEYHNSWRETYIRCKIFDKQQQQQQDTTNNNYSDKISLSTPTNTSIAFPLFRPISVKGFYSDILFRTWYVSQASILSSWLKYDNLPRLPITNENNQLHNFIQYYDEPGIPVILTNIANQWPAYNKWTWNNLYTNYGQCNFHAAGFDFPFHQYLDYMKKVQDDTPLIIFDKYFHEKSNLCQDYTVPPHFSHDLFTLLESQSSSTATDRLSTSHAATSLSSSTSESSTTYSSDPYGNTQTSSSPNPQYRPDYRWLIIGPKRSGSVFHQDPNGTSAFNACIRGTKKWFLFPPHIIPPGVYPSEDGSTVATTMSVMEWFIDFYEAARKIREKYTPLQTKKRTRNDNDEEDNDNLANHHHQQQRMRTLNRAGGGNSATNTAASSSSTSTGYHKARNSKPLSTISNSNTLATATTTIHDPRQVPMEGLVKEGEIIFVPRGWWHIVLNVEDTVAITQNFCTPSGLSDVLQFCRTKEDSISGFNNEENKTLFYQRFYNKLQEYEPELLKQAETKLHTYEQHHHPQHPANLEELPSTIPSTKPAFSFGFKLEEEEDEEK